MGDLCIAEDVNDIPSTSHQVGLASTKDHLLERHCCRGNKAHCDAVSNTSLVVDSFKFCSSEDDIVARLVTLAAYLHHRLIRFVEDLIVQDIDRWSEDVVVYSSSSHSRSSSLKIYEFDGEGCLSCPKNHIDDRSPQICGRRASDTSGELPANTRCEIVKTSYSQRGVSIIIQGLKLPLFGFRLAWMLALASWRCSFYYIQCAQVYLCSIISRVHKTLIGSSQDIGWLQHSPGMAPVEDGTARFLELLETIRFGKILVLMLKPGFCFIGTRQEQKVSVEHNACELKHYVEELYWGSGKRVMLLGHSKGGVDAAAALSLYWSDLKDKVAGLALVQSPFAGSPIASDILREGQIADKETRKIMELLICKLIKGDIRALEDLTYDKRREFIMKHKFPEHIPLISFHTEASIAPGVLATMTQIAKAEIPWLPLPKLGVEEPGVVQAGCQVPVVIPLSAAMAVCALHLQLRYGEKSDGLVTRRDAEVPGSVVVKPDRKLDHSWMVYSSSKNSPNEPDCNEMCEALLTMLMELGKIKEESNGNYTGSHE